MRDYSKVVGSFWTGETGRLLRGNMQAQIVAMYLITTYHGNMIGVFHCPILYIAHETGSTLQGASEGLQTLIEGGFCSYDEVSEIVWVHESAKFQIGDQLSVEDKRVKGVQKDYEGITQSHIRRGFYEKYREAFHLKESIKDSKPLASTLQAPCKPVAVTVTVTETDIPPSAPSPKKHKPSKTTIPESFTISEAVKTWAEAHGHSRLNERLEHFVNTAKAKGYEYADWDAALRNAIADDWAKLGKPKPQPDKAKPIDVQAWARQVAGIV